MSSIKEQPEFASLCSFIHLFGDELNVSLSHNQLAKFLEVTDAENVPKIWIDIHRRLLSRIKYHCSIDKWEGTLKKCLFNVLGYESELANLNGTNYFSISADNRAKILNILFDCQFDRNIKFKEKVNLKLISDLRTQPFGSDIHGCIYWLFVDSDVSVIMYKENLEEESFKIVAESLDDLHKLQELLQEVDYENVNLSKFYLENSLSEEIDNSRNQSPLIENLSGILEKSVAKVNSISNENNEIITEDTTENSEDIIPDKVTSEDNLEVNIESDEILKIDIKEENNITSLEEVKENNNELETNCVTPVKIKKKVGRKHKENSPLIEDESSVNIGLRRSERKRKPVSLFSINYVDSCKKLKTDIHKSEKDKIIDKVDKKDHKKIKEKRKKGRPRKSTEFSSKIKEKKKYKKSKNKHKKSRGHKKHRSQHPWENADSSDELNDVEDDDEAYLHEESDGPISEKELWNDKPESDFDPDKISCSSDEETSKARGRNYFRQKTIKKEKQELDDKPCQICLRNNIPEMILLCDDCDLGHHAMCMRPSLMIIPEGDWFCPKCQHKKLLNKLSDKILELEKSLAKNNAKIRMQERLNFVNISMTNILSKNQERRPTRKLFYESDTGSLTDCNSSSQSLSSSSGSYNSSDNSSESESKPCARYKFRENSRKENTKYNFEEIDRIFDDALENDEKYKLLKKESVNRDKNSEFSEYEESEPEYDYSGIEPRKKSSGKDMANIINENQQLARPVVKKKRLKNISDNDDYEDDIKDTDFKLSDQSDSEFDEYECIEAYVSNCSDDDWIASKKRSTRKSSKKKSKNRHNPEFSSSYTRPRRNATRNINYRNMLCDEDDEDEEGELDEPSPEYESSENDSKPPPVVSRRKDKFVSRLKKKRIISDSEYEDENSKSESIADSGSTEKLEIKRKLKPDLNSDSENEDPVKMKVPKIENTEHNQSPTQAIVNEEPIKLKAPKIENEVCVTDDSIKPLYTPVKTPIYPSLGILNPMRAKGDEDDDVENEVESETECDLTISMGEQDVNNLNVTQNLYNNN